MLSAFWALFSGTGRHFHPFESLVLHAVRARLAPDSATRFQRQIDVVNKIQRLADGKEVNLYQVRWGKATFDDALRFPDAADEAVLAQVVLASERGSTKLRSDVVLAKGRVFSLLFNAPPKQFFQGVGLNTVRPSIVDVKILLDPMRPRRRVADQNVSELALTGWLLEWTRDGRASDLREPLPESARSEHLGRIDAGLPADYLELVAQSDGAKLGSCTVYGLAAIRKVVTATENYYLLTEVEGSGALVVREGDDKGELHLLSYESDEVRSLGYSLKEAVCEFRPS
jgi:hypothetical protein